jgi:hypothetical protein
VQSASPNHKSLSVSRIGGDQLVLESDSPTETSPQGSWVMKLSAPHSRRKPSRRSVWNEPPSLGAASIKLKIDAWIEFVETMGGSQAGDPATDHRNSFFPWFNSLMRWFFGFLVKIVVDCLKVFIGKKRR